MKVLFGVPVIRRYDLLEKLLESLRASEVQPDHVCVVDNGAKYGLDDQPAAMPASGTVFRPLRNLGVSGAWNSIVALGRLHEVDRVIISNDDIELHPPTLGRIVAENADLVRAPGFALFSLRTSVVDRIGWFDENFWPAYCLTPETPVLLSDLRWVPIGDLRVGQTLVGVEEHVPSGRAHYGSRRYELSRVAQVSMRRAPALRVILADGREVRCTEDHRWLAKRRLPLQPEWIQAGNLRPGQLIVAPLVPWRTETGFDAGWLSGILDGEGSLRHGGKVKVGVSFAQKEGAVLDRALAILREMGIPYTSRVNKQMVASVEINVKRFALELLGRVRPVRLLQERLWVGKHLRSKGSPNTERVGSLNNVAIEYIEPAGMADVVTIETSSRTFLANGLVSHNCEDNDFAWRAKLAELSIADPQGLNVPHVGSASLHCLTPTQQSFFGRRFEELLAYYTRKWGGRPGEERFTEPFNGTPPPGWTLKPVTEGGVSPSAPWLLGAGP